MLNKIERLIFKLRVKIGSRLYGFSEYSYRNILIDLKYRREHERTLNNKTISRAERKRIEQKIALINETLAGYGYKN